MKKLNFVIFGTLMLTCLTTQTFAETTIPWTKEGCESVQGVWVTAHSATDAGCDAAHCNGKHFCRSPNTMHWWAALIWCKAIGHKLVNFDHICPGIPTDFVNGVCSNAKGIANHKIWTALPFETEKAFAVHLGNGNVWSGGCMGSGSGNDSRQNRGHACLYALCEE